MNALHLTITNHANLILHIYYRPKCNISRNWIAVKPWSYAYFLSLGNASRLWFHKWKQTCSCVSDCPFLQMWKRMRSQRSLCLPYHPLAACCILLPFCPPYLTLLRSLDISVIYVHRSPNSGKILWGTPDYSMAINLQMREKKWILHNIKNLNHAWKIRSVETLMYNIYA